MFSKKICISIAFVAVALTSANAETLQEGAEPIFVRESACAYIFEMISGPKKGSFGYSTSGVQVMRDTKEGLLKLKPPKNAKIVSITCMRSTPVPFPLDYRVILSGYDFYTTNMDKGREFKTKLSKVDGAYTLTMEKGELDENEKKMVDQLLLQFLEDEKKFIESE